MKNIYVFLLSLVTAGLLVTSCIKDEDIQTQPECVITDFSINDIETEVTIQLADGRDSIITRVIGGESIRFNINQIENKIYSVDSLPKWADITGIVPKVSTTGYVYVKEASDSTFRYFASGNDSIDFTKPVKFLVMASDGVSSKEYTAQIFKRESETDSLVWRPVEGVDLQLEGKHHSLVFADRIYVFSENDGTPTVTSSSFLSEGASWRKPEPITCKQGIINWESVVSYGEKLYAINSDGKICHSTNEERGVTWTVASERTFTKLLSADKNYIYACDDNAIWASTDLENWKECGSYDLDMLPTSCFASISYPSKTNPSISMSVMGGLTASNEENAVLWFKISSDDENLDQKWNYIQVTEENLYGCPKMENLSMAYYKNEIYAIGGNNEGIYISADNGISWHLQTKKKMLPAEITGQSAPASIVSGNGYIWIIQSGGKVWKGKIG